MYKRYNISDYVTTMDITRTSPEYCRLERKRFGSFRHDLKSTVIKSYFFDGYFEKAGFNEEDMSYIINGYSPIRTNSSGEEYTILTIHHKKPLSCGGETRPSNLIPLPKGFHKFLHDKVFDPQVSELKENESATIVGVPDFTKISLEMMMDSGFVIQYHKYMVDKHHFLPSFLAKSKDKCKISAWYRKNFSNFIQ